MKAYDYEINGNAEVLKDIADILEDQRCRINWFNFENGDIYYTSNGHPYKITINHETKQVFLAQ